MNTITIGRTTYKLRDTSTIFADHAKCLGKHKPVKSKGGEKRLYPTNGHEMSTADYVWAYETMNSANKLTHRIGAWDWQPLTEHVSQPQGEDTFEVEA
jgi:hypothetical protein